MKNEFRLTLKKGIILTASIYILGLLFIFGANILVGLLLLIIAGILSFGIIILTISSKLNDVKQKIEEAVDEIDSKTEENPYQSIIYTLVALIPLALILYFLFL